MIDRPGHRERLRAAFDSITRPPPPTLAARIRAGVMGSRVPSLPAPAPLAEPGPPAPPVRPLPAVVPVAAEPPGAPARRPHGLRPALAAGAALLVVASAVAGLAAVHSRLPAPSRTAATAPPTSPASRVTPAPSPSASLPAPSPTETASPPPAAAPPVPPAVAAPPGFACAALGGGAAAPATMTTARVGTHDGYDRFVLQFSGPVPRFEVQPQQSTTFGQAGGSLTVRGSAAALVTLHDASGAGAYGAPTDFQPGYPVLQEARLLSDSRGEVEWALGLSRPACLRTMALGSPSRLVVDVSG